MIKVEVLSDFFVVAASTHYFKGWKGEVSNELAERHGPEGTGFLKELPEDALLTKIEDKPKNKPNLSKAKETK